MSNIDSMQLLCVSKNGINIYYDPISSHAATHFNDTDNLKELVISILENKVLTKDKEHFEHDFKKTVGKSDLLKTSPEDKIIYAKRLNRDNYTRFIMDKTPVDSTIVTMVLYKNELSYTLYSAWVGQLVPSFPGAETATPESIPFWRDHALVWGTQEIQPNSETNDWPWS